MGNVKREEQPGKRQFDTELEAQEFARARVTEMWITHYHPTNDGRWNVDWWCQ